MADSTGEVHGGPPELGSSAGQRPQSGPYTLYPRKDMRPRGVKPGMPGRKEPTKETLTTLRLGTNRVVVVGLIGGSLRGKAQLLASLADSPQPEVFDNIFQVPQELQGHCRIEMYHSAEQNIVYLNLVSIHDTFVLADMLEKLEKDTNQTDIHMLLEKKEYHHLKAMLFMFHVCHFMLVVHHGMTFDLHYLRIFRILQNVKQMMGTALNSFLNNCSHLPEFKNASNYTPGRCVPALSFIFLTNAVPSFLNEDVSDKDSQELTSRPIAEKMRYALEAQVRYIIRRLRVVPASENAVQLFTLDSPRLVNVVRAPNEDPFEHYDPLAGFLSEASSYLLEFPWLRQSAHRQDMLKLREFLIAQAKAHKELVASKRMELSTSMDFYLSCLLLQQFFLFIKRSGPKGQRTDAVDKLKNFLDPEFKFSQSRCLQALPAAKETYLRDLPQCYPSSIHEKQLDKALRYFYQNARGPAVETFIARLKEECADEWENGRQLCDALSLTGRPCTYRIHDVPSDEGKAVHGRPLQRNKVDIRTKRHFKADESRHSRYRSNPHHPSSRQEGGRWRVKPREQDDKEEYLAHEIEELRPRDRERNQSINDDEEDDDEYEVGAMYSDESDDDGAHDGEEDDHLEEEEDRCMPHSSAYRTLHACNCGRSRRIREDPFDLKEANCSFFLMDCCKEAVTFDFPPSDKPSSSFSSWALCRLGTASSYRREIGIPFEGFLSGGNFLSYINVPCHYYPIPNTSHLNIREPSTVDASGARPTGSTSRQPFPTTPLPTTAAGFASIFSEIADEVNVIVTTTEDAGSKAATNLSTALNLAFLHRRQKFLESKGHALHVAASNMGIAVPLAVANPAPSRALSPPRSPVRRRERPRRKERERDPYDGDYERDYDASSHKLERPQATFVNVLLGFEYECPAGHRFLALPSKAHKHDRNYRMKNKGDQRVRLNSDIPLFAPCMGASCAQKIVPPMAQLQRIYFVTPNQPESILLRPRIQWSLVSPVGKTAVNATGSNVPAPHSGVITKHNFDTGLEIALPPNSFLCLRLPYIYTISEEGKQKSLLQNGPSDPYQCTLMRDFLHVAVPQAYTTTQFG